MFGRFNGLFNAARRGRRRGASGCTGSFTPAMEPLEARTLLATIEWDGGPLSTGTNWHDPVNWVGDVLPVNGDDVIIAFGVSIQYFTGTLALNTLQCDRPLTVSGGTLGVAAASSTSDLLTLDGGSLTGGPWLLSGPGLTATDDPGNGLSGATISGDISLSEEDAYIRITGGITVNGLITLFGREATIAFDGGVQVFGGNADVLFGGFSGHRRVSAVSGAVLTIAATVSLSGERGKIDSGSGSGSIVNLGTIWADTDSGTIEVAPSVFTNQGTLRATGDGVLLVAAGTWVNSGVISINEGTIGLGGTFDITQGIGLFSRTGGEVLIDGTLLNSNHTLTLSPATGSWRFNNGQIIGGTIDLVGGATLEGFGTRSGRLAALTLNGNLSWLNSNFSAEFDGVTVNGNIDFAGFSTLTIKNGLVLNGVLTVSGANSEVRFDGSSQSLSGAAIILLRHEESYFWARQPLTLVPGVSLSGYGRVFGDIVNQGIITADTSSKILTIARGSFQNHATVTAAAGSILRIGETLASVAVFTNNGTVLATAASTLKIGPSSDSGPITFSNVGLFRVDGLSQATVGSQFVFNLITLLNTGTIEAAGGGTVTIGTLNAMVPVAFDNDGLARALTGGVLTLQTLLTTEDIGDLRAGTGGVVLKSLIDNFEQTLTIDSTTGSWIMSGAEIVGGTIVLSAGQSLLADSNNANTLDGVVIQGDLRVDQPNARLRITGGLTLNGVLAVSGDGAVVWFDGGMQAIQGVGAVNLGGPTGSQSISADAGAIVSISPSVSILSSGGQARVTSGAVGDPGGAWVNLGVMSGQLVIDATLTNSGLIEARDGLTLSIEGNVTTYTAGTLTGGAWRIGPGSSLHFGPGNITTNQAHFTLDGAGASCAALSGLSANQGTFVLAGGRDLTLGGGFNNSGVLDLGPGSELALSGHLTLGASSTLKLAYAAAQAPSITATSASVAGSVEVSWAGNYTPPSGVQPPFLSAPSMSGTFSAFTAEVLGVRAKRGLVYSPTSIAVVVSYPATTARI
jgi:hypothetical protein